MEKLIRPDIWHCHKWIKCNQIWAILPIYDPSTQHQPHKGTRIMNIWVRSMRQAKRFIFRFRNLFEQNARASLCLFDLQCTQDVCQGMDNATLRTNMQVVLGLDERMYIIIIIFIILVGIYWLGTGWRLPVACHSTIHHQISTFEVNENHRWRKYVSCSTKTV